MLFIYLILLTLLGVYFYASVQDKEVGSSFVSLVVFLYILTEAIKQIFGA